MKIQRHGWRCVDMTEQPPKLYDNKVELVNELRDVYKAVVRLARAGEIPYSIFSGEVVLNNRNFHHQGQSLGNATTPMPHTNEILPEDVLIDYTNWKGNRRIRRIRPIGIIFGQNKWHPKNQWLLEAYDLEDRQIKSFALHGIHAIMPVPRNKTTIPKTEVKT